MEKCYYMHLYFIIIVIIIIIIIIMIIIIIPFNPSIYITYHTSSQVTGLVCVVHVIILFFLSK